jgi:hypothetical protein
MVSQIWLNVLKSTDENFAVRMIRIDNNPTTERKVDAMPEGKRRIDRTQMR